MLIKRGRTELGGSGPAALENSDEDLEDFLTDLLTPEERSRRMSRTNSWQSPGVGGLESSSPHRQPYVVGGAEEEMMAGQAAGLSAAEMFMEQAHAEFRDGSAPARYAMGGAEKEMTAAEKNLIEMFVRVRQNYRRPPAPPPESELLRQRHEGMRLRLAFQQQEAAQQAVQAQGPRSESSSLLLQEGVCYASDQESPLSPNLLPRFFSGDSQDVSPLAINTTSRTAISARATRQASRARRRRRRIRSLMWRRTRRCC
ncbi:hypothetical protein B0H17DRAFT_652757 [Mycena rosella]|uniref:Uncharacterized protein n=1 Tax=Mycena rosella TaxID=1033263 RepID=A0AAD7DDG3_MYCRO|nr:hypothetical protein B0H17DRAFT_652757 [Mycena rosella]